MELFDIDKYTDDNALRQELKRMSIGLTPDEVRRIKSILGRNPSVVELYLFNGEWSEHCSYKSSRALLQKYLFTEGPTVMLGPVEDAGILHLATINGENYGLVISHESHNHPSQVLPVEGAATGIGGIVRDVDCMGARVVGVLDPLRFGDPKGKFANRTKWIANGVIEGIMEYANALGVPNLGGDVYFNSSFDDNCLVNVVAIGIVKESEIVHSAVPPEAAEIPYDVILVGKSTDASGFGGAAFASEILDEDEDSTNMGAVQVHDPFLENVLVMRKANAAVMTRARELGYQIGFKDLGGAGLACASAELGDAGGFGLQIDLDKVHKSIPNLPPEITALSETQERFLLACPEAFTDEVLRIYNEDWELPRIYEGACASVIGKVTTEPQYILTCCNSKVVDAPIAQVTKGIRYARNTKAPAALKRNLDFKAPEDLKAALLGILSDPNVACKEAVFRYYDTEVQGNAVLRPGEADACVIAPLLESGSTVGVAISADGNPFYGRLDPYWGGANAVAEAVRNVVAVGAYPLGLTDCLNFGDPEKPEAFWQFEQAIRGLSDAAKNLELPNHPGCPIPIVSGNVSFYNESSAGVAIDPSPIIACAGKLDDYSKAVSQPLKEAGNLLILVGERRDELGGSAYLRYLNHVDKGQVPTVNFTLDKLINKAVLQAIEDGLVEACHDISDGGLLICLAEMAMSTLDGRALGACIEIDSATLQLRTDKYLFSENGGFVIEIKDSNLKKIRKILAESNTPFTLLGKVNETPVFEVFDTTGVLLSVSVEKMAETWRKAVPEALG